MDPLSPLGSVNPWGPAGKLLMLTSWVMQVLWHQNRANRRSCSAPFQGREVGVGKPGDRLHQVQWQEGQQKPQAARVEPEAEAQGAVTIPAGNPARNRDRALKATKGEPFGAEHSGHDLQPYIFLMASKLSYQACCYCKQKCYVN
jgi:hypothetical protein